MLLNYKTGFVIIISRDRNKRGEFWLVPAAGTGKGCEVRRNAALGGTARLRGRDHLTRFVLARGQKLPLVGCVALDRREESYSTGTERRAPSIQPRWHRSSWPSPPRDS